MFNSSNEWPNFREVYNHARTAVYPREVILPEGQHHEHLPIAGGHRDVAAGDLVFICPPAGVVSAFGLGRGYFRRGLCAGGAAPLIKTVAAVAGANVAIGADVGIDGAALARSRLSPVDGEGRPIAPWSGGPVPPGHLFLHSSFVGSYDSRYFGPVPQAGLLGLARPVLVFNP